MPLAVVGLMGGQVGFTSTVQRPSWHDVEGCARVDTCRRATVKQTEPTASLAMPPVLSDEDLAFWDENGYVVAKSVISREQAARTAADVWAFRGQVRSPPAPGCSTMFQHSRRLLNAGFAGPG
eukprot:SAG31_NODE_9544_length_1260_cov_1.603790_2_plen_123_part_00